MWEVLYLSPEGEKWRLHTNSGIKMCKQHFQKMMSQQDQAPIAGVERGKVWLVGRSGPMVAHGLGSLPIVAKEHSGRSHHIKKKQASG